MKGPIAPRRPRRPRRPLRPHARLPVLPLLLAWLAAMGVAYEWGGPAARGVRELREKRHADAMRSLTEGRKELPRSAAARYDQGLAARALGLRDSARVAWGDAMALDGDEGRAAAAYNLGNDAMRAGKIDDAIEWYRASLRADWKKADAKRNLEEAIRRLREASPAPTPPSSGGKGQTGPSGSGQGGGDNSPPNQNNSPGAPPPSEQREAPSTKGPIPSKEDAELWLKALESERRSQRAKDQRRQSEERGDRDW